MKTWMGWFVVFGICLLFGYNGALAAPPAKASDETIRLEKAKIIGAVERPGISFSLPWKDPELPPHLQQHWRRSFRSEILQWVDLESLRRWYGRHP